MVLPGDGLDRLFLQFLTVGRAKSAGRKGICHLFEVWRNAGAGMIVRLLAEFVCVFSGRYCS